MLAQQTMDRVLALAALPGENLSQEGRAMATLSLFDWLAVGRAGAAEPVGAVVRGLVVDEGGRPAASVFGANIKLPVRAAALANGTISHALDYDDTHFAHIGHLSANSGTALPPPPTASCSLAAQYKPSLPCSGGCMNW